MLQKMNLTAITDVNEVMERHIEDSLAILPPIHDSYISHCNTSIDSIKLVDVGTGAGLPGLVLAIACPGESFTFSFCFVLFFFFFQVACCGLCFMCCHWYCILCVAWKVTLLESMNKRCVFLEHAISVTGLSNVEVVRERAEVLLVVFCF